MDVVPPVIGRKWNGSGVQAIAFPRLRLPPRPQWGNGVFLAARFGYMHLPNMRVQPAQA